LPIPHRRWTDLSMDFITHLPPSGDEGYDSIMVVVDRLTKMAHFIPCHKTITARQCADLFVTNVFKLHGIPTSIVSDRYKLFTSEFWSMLFYKLGTSLDMSSGYHPQTDGQTERMNRTLEEMLRSYCGDPDNQFLWSYYLPLVEFAYNNTPQTSTGQTPFFLCYGLHPLSPVDLVHGVTDESSDYLETLSEALAAAELSLERAQHRMSVYYNKKRRAQSFKVGDLVYVHYCAFPPKRRNSKISPLYHPQPFRITQLIGSNAYKLDTPSTWKLHNVFHASQLRLTPPRRELIPRVVNELRTRYGQPMALVSFENASRDEDAWVPLKSLLPKYKSLVDAYKAMDEAMAQELYGDL
jgi:hypothetical protein